MSDYVTISGQKDSGDYDHLLYTIYDWSVELDTDQMLAHWTISATIHRTRYGSDSQNYVSRVRGSTADNYIKLDNKVVWSTSPGYYGGDSRYPLVYTGTKSCCADRISTLKYTKGSIAGKYPFGYCHLITDYKYDTPIDANGNTRLQLSSVLHDTNWKEDDSSFTTTPSPHNPFNYTFRTGDDNIPVADIFSKVKTVKNSTGNWADGGYVWLKENNGWKKKKMYRKDRVATQGDSGWTKK